MKIFWTMAFVLISQTSLAGFKISIKETEKPQVAVEKNTKSSSDVDSGSGVVNTNLQENESDDSDMRDDDLGLNPRPGNVSQDVLKADMKMIAQNDNTGRALFDNQEHPISQEVKEGSDGEITQDKQMSRYDELMAIKEENMRKKRALNQNVSESKTTVTSSPLVSENQMLKPLLLAAKGATVEKVFSEWAEKNSYTVVYELGVWERIKDMKLSTNATFDSNFEVAVEEFLEALNGLKQLKQNSVELSGCIYPNRYVVIKANQECME